MAALLHFAPPRGATTAARTIARLNDAIDATLRRQAQARPKLICCWTQDADGRLSCHWDIEPSDIPIPPH